MIGMHQVTASVVEKVGVSSVELGANAVTIITGDLANVDVAEKGDPVTEGLEQPDDVHTDLDFHGLQVIHVGLD